MNDDPGERRARMVNAALARQAEFASALPQPVIPAMSGRLAPRWPLPPQ
jgi:hypothetical protein